MRAGATSSAASLRGRRPRSAPLRLAGRGAAALGLVGLLAAGVLWLAFAGSAATLPAGVSIAGVDVGGLTPEEARAALERRAASLAGTAVAFTADDRTWRLTPAQLGVEVDWAAAVEAARRQGAGFGPVRGFRRLHTRVFEVELTPPTRVYDAALRHGIDRIADDVAQAPREAAIVLRGLEPVIVPARTGRALDRAAAERVVVRALASFDRAPVGLPVRVDRPRVTAARLRPVAEQVRVAVSAPVRLELGTTRWKLPRWRIAELLALPRDGVAALALGGPAAEHWLDGLARAVEAPAADAAFEALADGSVRLVPATPGRELDPVATAEAILRAATTPAPREAKAVIVESRPALTTAEAEAMGVERVLASYSTAYAGSADRIHNLQLAISLLDGARVAPGAEFSFNEVVGERTAERGFRAAPVIIDGKYEDDIGGGVSQVATTIFNAAWEAGLKVTARAPHALYISRYPLGRDATVNYPNLDLRFRNDTGRWIVLRAASGSTGIAITLLGPDTGRRVVSEPGPLVATGAPPVEREPDPTLTVGEQEVESEGQPSRSISVRRTVYDRDGTVLAAETWTTNYRAEPKLVRYGTKPKPKPEPEAKPKPTAPADEPAEAPVTTAPAPPPPGG